MSGVLRIPPEQMHRFSGSRAAPSHTGFTLLKSDNSATWHCGSAQ